MDERKQTILAVYGSGISQGICLILFPVFGLALTVLNAYAFDLFRGRADTAVTALHVLTGLGQVGAALILGLFLNLGAWWGTPLALSAILVLLLLQVRLSLQLALEEGQRQMAPAVASLADLWPAPGKAQ